MNAVEENGIVRAVISAIAAIVRMPDTAFAPAGDRRRPTRRRCADPRDSQSRRLSRRTQTTYRRPSTSAGAPMRVREESHNQE